ncbi:MAG: LD-carboxypeptidase [Gemmatimonadetes bacterium]|nr:LD-carboxypeptidase [Gemmatimonadota bacterium]
MRSLDVGFAVETGPAGASLGHPTGDALRAPRVLGPGATVALVAPSGVLAGDADVDRAVATAVSLGWQPRVGASVLARDGYFAGSDTARAHDLLAALDDDAIDGIWCLRGGYGATRLLPLVAPAITRHVQDPRHAPKALLGYSDITALHAAWQQAGGVSYHAPVARAVLPPFSRDALVAAVGTRDAVSWQAPDATTVRGGVATGRLVGGNLALMAALCGTPWAVRGRDAIVVLEDIGEATYRLDRMLVQLRLAGTFDGCVALACGQFTDCPEGAEGAQRSVHALVQELAAALNVPTVLGLPIGHVDDQWTLPLGGLATLDADAHTLQFRTTLHL